MFLCLLETFKSWGNGWQVGNVFDTLTDFVFYFPDAEPTPGAVVQAAYERWGKIQGSMCWYDDYGWWGIASAKAFDDKYANIFGPYRDEFQQIATDCWKTMHTGKPNKPYSYKGGPNVWENRDPPDYFTSPAGWAVPRFPGGVWQYDMFENERKDPPDCSPPSSNPSNPKTCLLGPFQNTVMNGLYLVLALRLAQQGLVDGTVEAAKDEMSFLNGWFNLQGDESLLQRFKHPDKSTLVRERVATYASQDGNKTYPPVEGYEAGGQWCGDQGLILGGMVDYLTIVPTDPLAENRAVSITRGVIFHMVDDLGVMPFSAGFNDQGDPDDYSCGSGVFWRYLLHAFSQNADLRTDVLNFVTGAPDTNAVYKSAEKAFTQRRPLNNNTLFMEFNIVACLLAAIQILKQANG